jgi:hypothetical protein
MADKKKFVLFVIVIMSIVALVLFGIYFFAIISKKNDDVNSPNTSIDIDKHQNDNEKFDFLIPGFPKDEIEFYKLDYISSAKFFVNTDPNNSSGFNEKNFAYYNIVFKTTTDKDELLQYYKESFDKSIELDYPMEDNVYGYIGEYRVQVSHYGHDNNAYMQVHLPKIDPETSNRYFANFPELVENDNLLTLYETSFGYLNQKGGEIEYTKYFQASNSGDTNGDGKDDFDEFAYLYEKYNKLYQEKEGYSADTTTGTLKWTSGKQNVVLVLSKDHGRVYLNIRELMD